MQIMVVYFAFLIKKIIGYSPIKPRLKIRFYQTMEQSAIIFYNLTRSVAKHSVVEEALNKIYYLT